ncbi:hypothetical protein HDU85_006815 [Gaertneriomyces sp. JEL0708]|nr:hypothetical protein HDU85_006815 [Gaertneriomyces sp. JEL0708]
MAAANRTNSAFVCLIVAWLLITLSMLGGIPVDFLRLLPWSHTSTTLTALWGWCPIMTDHRHTPIRDCQIWQRPCIYDAQQLSRDRVMMQTQFSFIVLAWVFTLTAIIVSLTGHDRKSIRLSSACCLVAALCGLIGAIMAIRFLGATVKEMKKYEEYESTRVGAGVYFCGVGAFVLLVGSAMFWMENVIKANDKKPKKKDVQEIKV